MRVNSRIVICVLATASVARGENVYLKSGGQPQAALVPPIMTGAVERIVPSTLNCHMSNWFGWSFPLVQSAAEPGLYIVAGNQSNNPVLAGLVAAGLHLNISALGDEGFRLFTHESGSRRFIIIAANSPAGLKHGCQELAFYRLQATASQAWVDWPMDISMKPQFANRPIYMLPCWSAYDSLESWQRVLRFNSELTINRVWFWLNGFPLMPQYGGPYVGTALADADNVRGLISLCRSEGMKFLIGGGWFHWHHADHAAGSLERGGRYYTDLFRLLPGSEGIFLEPPGETFEVKPEVWRPRTAVMERMMEAIWRCRPEFEFVVAIGRWNDPNYRQAVHAIDTNRLFWWWCWGDPTADNALAQHPLVLRWHTTLVNGEAQRPPGPDELPLEGIATSYDPGMGFGNPWNGWAKMGVTGPRNFDPYTMPYFSHQYWFRERCWDVTMTREQFSARLARRLFDADMPAESITHYLNLADYCPDPSAATEAAINTIDAFVAARAGQGSARNRDTFVRMREAIDGIRAARADAAPSP